nr:IS630 family transposase [Deinococcus sp. Arct2-2]
MNDLKPYLQAPARLVFVDESGFNTAMTRPYGRAHRTQRAHCAVPRNWGRNHTLICAVQAAGPCAPMIIEGAVNGTIFEWYVQEVLCPALSPGQVVVLDNLSAHHRASVRTRIEAHGCSVLFLPPYSPDFNPIEMLFSKVKALVRAGDPRDLTTLFSSIWAALDAVSLRDVFGWFTHAFPDIFLCQML